MGKNKTLYYLLLLFLAIGLFIFYKKKNVPVPAPDTGSKSVLIDTHNAQPGIKQLTSESVVVPYLKSHHQLPAYYITKREARAQGWNAATGNLCEVLPGKAIGGDYFSNREGSLPAAKSRKWFEADLNYDCKHRNADRLLYSNDGLVYITYDHYKSFQQR